jgi:hypothetical protein
VNGEQARHAGPFQVEFAHAVAGALRGDHRDIDAGGRIDELVVDVEAVGEHDHVALFQVRLDRLFVDGALQLVGHDDHDDVGFFGGVGDAEDAQAARLGLGLALAPLGQPDTHIDAAVLQVERVGVPLAAVADDGHFLALKLGEIGVFVVVDRRGHSLPSS